MGPYDGSVLAEGGSAAWAAVRSSMGVASQLARHVNLGAMTPQGALATTGYCLANAGKEDVVYLPDGGEVSVDLAAASGSLQVEWLDPRQGRATAGGRVSGAAQRRFHAPFEGDAVLHLRAR